MVCFIEKVSSEHLPSEVGADASHGSPPTAGCSLLPPGHGAPAGSSAPRLGLVFGSCFLSGFLLFFLKGTIVSGTSPSRAWCNSRFHFFFKLRTMKHFIIGNKQFTQEEIGPSSALLHPSARSTQPCSRRGCSTLPTFGALAALRAWKPSCTLPEPEDSCLHQTALGARTKATGLVRFYKGCFYFYTEHPV